MNELIEYLLNYAFDHGIGYKLVRADPYDPSLSLKKHNLMVINLSAYGIPFRMTEAAKELFKRNDN